MEHRTNDDEHVVLQVEGFKRDREFRQLELKRQKEEEERLKEEQEVKEELKARREAAVEEVRRGEREE